MYLNGLIYLYIYICVCLCVSIFIAIISTVEFVLFSYILFYLVTSVDVVKSKNNLLFVFCFLFFVSTCFVFLNVYRIF